MLPSPWNGQAVGCILGPSLELCHPASTHGYSHQAKGAPLLPCPTKFYFCPSDEESLPVLVQPPWGGFAVCHFIELKCPNIPSQPGRCLFPLTLVLPPTHRRHATAPPSLCLSADREGEVSPSLFSIVIRIIRREKRSRTRDRLLTQRLPQTGREIPSWPELCPEGQQIAMSCLEQCPSTSHWCGRAACFN